MVAIEKYLETRISDLEGLLQIYAFAKPFLDNDNDIRKYETMVTPFLNKLNKLYKVAGISKESGDYVRQLMLHYHPGCRLA